MNRINIFAGIIPIEGRINGDNSFSLKLAKVRVKK